MTSGDLTLRESVLPAGGQGPGQSLTREQFFYHVQTGTPMHMFQGGHGAAANTQLNPVRPGGGLVLIADTINIEAGADFMGLFADVGTSFQGPSAGGMLVLVANTINISPSVGFEVGAEGNVENADFWGDSANDNQVPGAANGHCFIVNLNTAEPEQLF